jgi:hypothetical protein
MKPGKYRHYKGKYYEVFGPALHTETAEKMVVYRGLYESPDLKDEYGDDHGLSGLFICLLKK